MAIVLSLLLSLLRLLLSLFGPAENQLEQKTNVADALSVMNDVSASQCAHQLQVLRKLLPFLRSLNKLKRFLLRHPSKSKKSISTRPRALYNHRDRISKHFRLICCTIPGCGARRVHGVDAHYRNLRA